MTTAAHEFEIRANRDGRAGFYVFIGADNRTMIQHVYQAAIEGTDSGCPRADLLATAIEAFARDHGISLDPQAKVGGSET